MAVNMPVRRLRGGGEPAPDEDVVRIAAGRRAVQRQRDRAGHGHGQHGGEEAAPRMDEQVMRQPAAQRGAQGQRQRGRHHAQPGQAVQGLCGLRPPATIVTPATGSRGQDGQRQPASSTSSGTPDSGCTMGMDAMRSAAHSAGMPAHHASHGQGGLPA